MNIFSKKNALVGFTVMQVLARRRSQRRNRTGLKLAAFIALGLVSAGILAALVGERDLRSSSKTRFDGHGAGRPGTDVATDRSDLLALVAAEALAVRPGMRQVVDQQPAQHVAVVEQQRALMPVLRNP